MNDDWRQWLDDPAAQVREADAVEAVRRFPWLVLRGPVFGVAMREAAAGAPWQLVKPVVDGMPQMARDGLQSHLFFTAKDDTDDPAVRRELLAAVDVLTREPVNEVEACGVRYRVVRGDEFVRLGEDHPEPPRPTDPEPRERSWERQTRSTPLRDAGFALAPERVDGPATDRLRLALREFSYVGARFPADVRAESLRAVESHPELVVLPTTFTAVEQEEDGWRSRCTLMATPHDARRVLYLGMSEMWAMLYELDDEDRARYAQAAEEYRALDHADVFRVDDEVYRICRVERLVRMGPDGPEPPRPSDIDTYGPMKMHPTMSDDGTLTHD